MRRPRLNQARDELDLWAATIVRYVGIVGLLMETFADHWKHPEALIVFGGLVGLRDVMGYRAAVRREVEDEVERARAEQHRHAGS